MEPSYKTRKIIERCLLWLMMAVILLAAAAQFSSQTAQTLARKENRSVRVAVLTSPAMLFSYNPSTQKAIVSVGSDKCNPKTREKCLPDHSARFFIPEQTNREEFWEEFKHALASWRYNPLLAARAAWTHLAAWHDRRTNLTPAEFLLLSLELSQIEAADFAVKLPPAKRGRKTKTPAAQPAAQVEDMAPLAVKDRPIVVEILNASGKRGLALALTQYLREQNEKGLLRVDVLQYDNYPSLQEESAIVDYSGRLVQVKQLSRAIGVNSEIKSETNANAICDTRIILGKDFQMPL